MKKYIATMSNNNNFQSLLSEFCDATATISSASVKLGNASLKPIILGTSSSSSSCSASNASSKSMDPTSTTDPSFSAPLLKERIERMMRIRQIRKSTGVIKKVGEDDCDAVDHAHSNNNQRNQNSSSVHIAVCATIVDDFPHEALWKKWMDGTGGEFSLEDGNYDLLRRLTDDNSASSSSDGYKITDKYFASAEMYVHAKNPERIQSEWLRSRMLPVSHRPNWNDVRIVRAILSLLETALRDKRTTHVLLCTESCVPVATLKETAWSVLLNEVCPWEEEGGGDGHHFRECPTKHAQSSRGSNSSSQRRVYWNQSYVNCYDRNSRRCTRFDEHNCWGMLQDSLPEDVVYKALPGWCLLSQKHAIDIINIPSQLAGMNLWPAFERVWAPEEVFFPTALAISGNMEEVSRRALTYCHWATHASNQKDRAHPIAYDGCFDDTLVSRARADGCLFMRKMKRPINLSVWEQIVVHHRRGWDGALTSIISEQQDIRRMDRYGNNDAREDRGSLNDRAAYDSRRSHNSTKPHKRKRELGSHSNYDNSRTRSHWRR